MNRQTIEALIERFYQPSSPAEVKEIESKLLEIQRSQDGWRLAMELFYSNSPMVRFFAVNTIALKLNEQGSSLTVTEIDELRNTLLTWMLEVFSSNGPTFIIQKIYSTLVTLFILPNANWEKPVRQLYFSFAAGQLVPETALDEFALSHSHTATLTQKQEALLLKFARTLGEEVEKVSHQYTPSVLYPIQIRCKNNFDDVHTLLSNSFSEDKQGEVLEDALQCFSKWMSYSPEGFEILQEFEDLMANIACGLWSETAFEATAEFFLDMFDEGLFQTVRSVDSITEWVNCSLAMELMTRLRDEDPGEECFKFGRLVLAHAQHIVTHMSVEDEQTSDEQTGNEQTGAESTTGVPGMTNLLKDTLSRCSDISRLQYMGKIDQHLSNAIVDFWEAYVNEVETRSSGNESRFPLSRRELDAYWSREITEFCRTVRLRLGSDGQFKGLPSDDPFYEYRVRVFGLIQMSWGAFAEGVLETLISGATGNHICLTGYPIELPPRHIMLEKIESFLSCLKGLPHYMGFKDRDQELPDFVKQSCLELFQSSMLRELTTLHDQFPLRLTTLSMDIIGEFAFFFRYNEELLWIAMDTVFAALLGTPAIQDSAARAILNLCERNRTTIVGRFQKIADTCAQIFRSGLSEDSEHLLVEALTLIISTIPDTSEQISHTRSLLQMIEQRVDDKRANQDDRSVVLSTLESLNAIGEAFQSSSESAPIELDDDDEQPDTGNTWNQSAGQQVRDAIVQFLRRLVEGYEADGEILDAACKILKTGFSSFRPGPLVFEPPVVADLITSVNPSNPRLDIVFSTTVAYLNSKHSSPHKISDVVPRFVTFVVQAIDYIKTAQNDPELARECLEVATVILEHWTSTLRAMHDHFSLICRFAVEALALQLPFTKQAAAKFWRGLFEANPASEVDRQFLESVAQATGPALTQALVNDVGGCALRSQLVEVTSVLRALVASYTFALPSQKWIKAALRSEAFPTFVPGRPVSETEKTRFLMGIMAARGSKGPSDKVVREFWTAARGLPTSYS